MQGKELAALETVEREKVFLKCLLSDRSRVAFQGNILFVVKWKVKGRTVVV